MHRLIKTVMTATLALTVSGAAVAQTQPGMPDIQKLTTNAMKLSIGVSAVGAGVAVIGFIVRHHHHKNSSETSMPAREKPNASLTTSPSSLPVPAELAGARRF